MDEINKNIDYLFSKINWADSALDAKSISIMNNLKNDIIKALAELDSKYSSLNRDDFQHFISWYYGERRNTLLTISDFDTYIEKFKKVGDK